MRFFEPKHDTGTALKKNEGQKLLDAKEMGIEDESTDVKKWKFKTAEDVAEEFEGENKNEILQVGDLTEKEKIEMFEEFKEKIERKIALAAGDIPHEKMFYDLYLRDIKTLDDLAKYLHIMGKEEFSRGKLRGIHAKEDLKEFKKEKMSEKLDLRKDLDFPDSVTALVYKYKLDHLKREDRENLMEAIFDIQDMKKKLGIGFASHYLKGHKMKRFKTPKPKKVPTLSVGEKVKKPFIPEEGKTVKIKGEKEEFKVVSSDPYNSDAILQDGKGEEVSVDYSVLEEV